MSQESICSQAEEEVGTTEKVRSLEVIERFLAGEKEPSTDERNGKHRHVSAPRGSRLLAGFLQETSLNRLKRKPLKCTKCHLMFTGEEKFKRHACAKGKNKTSSSTKKAILKDRKTQESNGELVPDQNITEGLSENRAPSNTDHRCQHCDLTFTRKSNLKRHVLTHTRERPHVCNECRKTFRQRSALKRHLKMRHCLDANVNPVGENDRKQFKCDLCKKTFKDHRYLENHVLRHVRSKDFPCEFCPFKFLTKAELVKHLRSHTKEKPFKCELCKKAFGSRFQLKRHLQSPKAHVEKDPKSRRFECPECNVAFGRRSRLSMHARTHFPEKPFECPECEVKFSYASALKRHALIHSSPT